jgi:uncharacterized protein
MDPEGGRKGRGEGRKVSAAAPGQAGETKPDAPNLRVRLDDIPAAGLDIETEGGAELVAAYVPPEEVVFELLEPARSRLRVTRQDQEVHVRGRVETRLRLACDRCLAAVEQPVDSQVDLTFLPHPKVEEEADLELGQDELEVEFYGPDQVIDLGEVIVEEMFLAVPFRVLCRQNCRGLCPGCGADLNREECRCQAKPLDPRLAALKDLKSE